MTSPNLLNAPRPWVDENRSLLILSLLIELQNASMILYTLITRLSGNFLYFRLFQLITTSIASSMASRRQSGYSEKSSS
jgi:hypothetical protein